MASQASGKNQLRGHISEKLNPDAPKIQAESQVSV
jgi:hypothetical protein